MSKKTYLIVSGLLSFNFLSNGLFPFFSRDILLLLMLGWIGFGFFYYKEYGSLYTTRNQITVFVFFVLFFLSMLSPVFKWNQSFFSTVVAMRANFVVLYLLTLLKITPTEDDFYKSFRFLGFLALCMSIIALMFPRLFLDDETITNIFLRQKKGSTDLLTVWSGSTTAVFFFYMLIQRMIERNSLNDFFWGTVFMAYIFLMQNRSTLICAVPFYIYAVVKSDVKYKKAIVILLVFAVGGYLTMIFNELIEETQTQLGDSKYNRWQAIQFFLFEQDYTVYNVLFGNGVPCADSKYLKILFYSQNTRLAFLSDIGMLGSFFLYGLITVGLIYWYVIKGVRDRRIPRFLRYFCWWIILVPTIHSFCLGLSFGGTIRIVTVIYLVIYYSSDSGNQVTQIQEKRLA